MAAYENPLQQSAQFAKGVGPARFRLLQKLGIETVEQLLFTIPRTYEDLSDFRPIAELEPEKLQTTSGEIVEMAGRTTSGGRQLLSIVLSDGSNRVIEGVWFNQSYLARKFRYGMQVTFSGKPQWRYDHWQMNNPRVQSAEDLGLDGERRDVVLPVYSLTEGLRPEAMRRMMKGTVETYADQVVDVLPETIRLARTLPPLAEALRLVHLPKTLADARLGRSRLAYEEFLVLQIALAHRRRDVRNDRRAPTLPISVKIDERIRALYPFSLTPDQNRAIAEITKDLALDRPMRRLLQADVGAGKTAVAVYALLLAVTHQCQAALMAPTEVLARQHWRTLCTYLASSRVRKVLLTGSLSERERHTVLGEIRMGQVDLVVGTQAIIQNDVEFHRLGLVVIDEQHRFGVQQRAQFKQLGVDPHYLVMTATPIPRTLALTVFGDLDVSVMRGAPPGRLPVITKLMRPNQREKLETRLLTEIKKGRQLYVVCPLVDVDEPDQALPTQSGSATGMSAEAVADVVPPTVSKGAEQIYAQLKAGTFKELEVGLLHGRLDDRKKDEVMDRFRRGEIQVLVATTVIEVGVDVPNATLMVIEHAEHFGLSQLHQLRGRVTRGPVAGECYLFADTINDNTKERLKNFVATTDGFKLAEEDVRLRGTGQFFGTRQHGLGEFRFGDILEDSHLLLTARDDAFQLTATDPGLRKPEHALLRQAVLQKYGETLNLAEIG